MPDSLSAFVSLVIKIDNRLFDRRQERRRDEKAYRPTRVIRADPHDPMDVDATAVVAHKKLTLEERKRRMDNKLCLYCGEPNHIATNCPKKSGNGKVRG